VTLTPFSRTPFFRVRRLGRKPYEPVWSEMREFTRTRAALTPDELWLVEHDPVYTLGQSGRRSHILNAGDIPVLATDRGGQVTYHGPGQVVLYTLVDLRRRRLGVRALVTRLEQSVIAVLAAAGVHGQRVDGAPGVYVHGAKVAALGLRVRKGCCYHGLALNVCMDLTPFSGIDPCGYPGLAVTRLVDLGVGWDVAEAGRRLLASVLHELHAVDAARGAVEA